MFTFILTSDCRMDMPANLWWLEPCERVHRTRTSPSKQPPLPAFERGRSLPVSAPNTVDALRRLAQTHAPLLQVRPRPGLEVECQVDEILRTLQTLRASCTQSIPFMIGMRAYLWTANIYRSQTLAGTAEPKDRCHGSSQRRVCRTSAACHARFRAVSLTRTMHCFPMQQPGTLPPGSHWHATLCQQAVLTRCTTPAAMLTTPFQGAQYQGGCI
jgi:hypothetical protein